MRPSKYLTGDEFENLFLHNGRYWFCDNEGEIIVIPAVGDIIEYENGERNIICFYSSFDANGDLALDVRMFDKLKTNIGRRGISNEALSITPEAEDGAWPPEGCKIIRDGRVIYPISKCYCVINKSLLLKQLLKQKALMLYHFSLNKTLNALDSAREGFGKLKDKVLDLYNTISSKASKILEAAKESLKKMKNNLLSLPSMVSRLWSAISDTFLSFFDMLKNKIKNMLEKIKNIFY